jgi:hypothetical protein
MNIEPGKSIGFVHKELDEYGLDPYSFRVLCHIIRRTGGGIGKCFASLENVSSNCKMSKRKAQQCIHYLLSLKVIKRDKSDDIARKTNSYVLNTNYKEWANIEEFNELEKLEA